MDKKKTITNEQEKVTDEEVLFTNEETGETGYLLPDVPKSKKERCEKIIHTAAIACGGVGTGFAQLPLADSAIITPIQIAMIVNLGKVFDREITDSMAVGIIGSLSGAILGRSVSAVLFGWFPVIGNMVNTATAVGLTEAIGHLAWKKFEEDYHSKNRDAVNVVAV